MNFNQYEISYILQARKEQVAKKANMQGVLEGAKKRSWIHSLFQK